MPSNAKSKMVSFRLSNEDYTRYRVACAAVGARNISELARVAIQRLTTNPDYNSQLCDFRAKLQAMNAELDRLTEMVTQNK
jgi:hypothetical protein